MSIHKDCTEAELIKLFKQGDQHAYTVVFERYKGILYSHAFRILGNHDEVEDIIQDVFLALWEKRERLTIRTTFSSYLYVAVRNRVFNLLSHQKVAARYAESLNEFLQEGSYIVDEKIRERELAAVIRREIEALPPKMRKIFLLSREGARTYQQIGERLGVSEKTVRNQVYNAVRILKMKISSFLLFFLFL